MKLNLLLYNRVQSILFAASLGLALLPSSQGAFPAPQWMQGGHAARITAVACSPDGTMIASASEDGTVKLWSANGTLLRTLMAQTNVLTAVAWSPDGSKIAVGTYTGGSIRVGWSTYTGLGLTYLWQAPSGWTAGDVSLVRVTTNQFGKVTALAFSTDSTRLASGCAAGSNVVHSVATGSVIASRPAYNTSARPAAVMSVAFSSSGMMASGGEDASIRVYSSSWNLLWNSINTGDAHTTNVTAVAFSPDGALLASASLDQTVKIWSTSSWTLQQTLTGHSDGVTSLAFNPDGQRIVSGCVDGTVKVWNRSTGACLVTIPAHALPVTALVFSTDGARVVSASEDNTVRIWSAADGAAVGTLGGQNACIGAVAISPDGILCASAGGNQSIEVRHARDGSIVRRLPGNTNYVSSIAFSPDSMTLASGGGPLDPTIRLWRMSDGELLRTIAATTNGVMALAWSPDGATLASGGDSVEQTLQLWDAADGTLRRMLPGHTNGVTVLAFSPGGDVLASGGRRFDHAVKVWAVTNGALLNTLTGHANNIEAVAFAPGGHLLASGSSGVNSLKVWQLSDSSSRNFGTGTDPVSAVAFSPDGTTLVSADRDSIKFWDVVSGALREAVTQSAYRVTTFAFSPNGNLFLYGREDSTVLLSSNLYGALGQPALAFVNLTSPSSASGAGFSASVQPWTHYIIQSSTNLAGWTYLMQAASGSNTLSISGLPVTNDPAVFLRAVTPP
ncbi:MAG: hypothetical protein JXQ71_11785 [Verrucomicrobia bacterium]|nr:hypothetical protein [Verrucomicrobiota bacterium]